MKFVRQYEKHTVTTWVTIGNDQYTRREDMVRGEVTWFERNGTQDLRVVSKGQGHDHLEGEWQKIHLEMRGK